MTRKTITVTRKDIRSGTPKDPHGCAIATSLKRQFPGWEITVCNTRASVGRYTAVLPPGVTDFTFWYDAHPHLRYLARPFTFSLEFYDSCPELVDYYEDPYYNSQLETPL